MLKQRDTHGMIHCKLEIKPQTQHTHNKKKKNSKQKTHWQRRRLPASLPLDDAPFSQLTLPPTQPLLQQRHDHDKSVREAKSESERTLRANTDHLKAGMENSKTASQLGVVYVYVNFKLTLYFIATI